LWRLTTIAATKTEIACDQQFTHPNGIFKGKTKIYEFKAHPDTYPDADFMIGFCGTASDMAKAAAFFANPEGHSKVPRIRGLMGLVLTRQNKLFTFDSIDAWLSIDQPFYAIGSGGSFALGALSQGASPKEAVKVAMKHDPFTGVGVKTYSFS
jgi:ATP-dependent protease HslVU (ClpYQ) peptidase subunit